jgi:hypothetical protein
MEATLSQPPLALMPPHDSTARRVGLVMTYNQRETCISAISSLLAQTLALDLIIVSDDCSTDGTYGVITDHFSKNGKPSNVELYQSEKNLGFIPHFNVLLKSYCRDDDLIFYNAGDDISEVNRVEEFYREYVTKGKPRYFLGHSYVTSFGSGAEEILIPPIESIKENRELCLIASAYHIGASQVFTGALFLDFGPILFDDCYEDLTLGYRALLKDAYHFIPRALLRYRVGGLSSWQKNPLEKKRGRLRSTLTQRAVDSIRSGDFEALTTIQDCYSQYGFSHTSHSDKLDILIISDNQFEKSCWSYSLSDHFKILTNVCNIQETTTSSYLEYRSRNDEHIPNNSLIWIVGQRIPRENLEALSVLFDSKRGQKIILDTGLSVPESKLENQISMFDLASQFLDKLPSCKVHSSCIAFIRLLSSHIKKDRFTYFPPIQSIDGPDPVVESGRVKRGLLVVCDNSEIVRSATTLIHNTAPKANDSQISIDTLDSDHITCDMRTIGRISTIANRGNYEASNDLSAYGFLIIASGLGEKNRDLIYRWWTLAASKGLPTFINTEAAGLEGLIHGRSCLFVGTEAKSWAEAFKIISSNSEALQIIASEARRHAYFHHSVQKQVSLVTRVLAKCVGQERFFDKFLAL